MDKHAPDKTRPDPVRRNLLKAAPLGALAVVAAGAARAETAPPGPAPQENEACGYRETEHVRRYYATAAYW